MAQDDWRIDYSNSTSYHNWVDPSRLDLTCTNKSVIGLIGSAYFLGYAIAALFIPAISDKVGRKWPLMVSLLIQTSFYALLFVSKDVYLTIACFLGVGVAAGGRGPISCVYGNEMITTKYQNPMTTAINIVDASVMLFQVLLYHFDRNWIQIHLVGIIGAVLIILGNLTLPESPKYYYANHKYHEARQILKKFARWNGSSTTPEEIDQLVFDSEKYLKANYDSQVGKTTEFLSQAGPDTSKLNLNPSTGIDVEDQVTEASDEEIIILTGKFSQVCEIPVLRRNFVGLILMMSVTSFSYYMINFQVKRVPGGIVESTTSSQAAELIAVICSGFLYHFCGAKWGLVMCYSVSLLGSVFMILYWNNIPYLQVFLFAAKFGVSAAFNIIFVAAV